MLKIIKIRDAFLYHGTQVSVAGICERGVALTGFPENRWINPEDLQELQISESMLYEFGFGINKSSSNFLSHQKEIEFKIGFRTQSPTCTFWHHGMEAPIQYFHQLQQCFRLQTGTEMVRLREPFGGPMWFIDSIGRIMRWRFGSYA